MELREDEIEALLRFDRAVLTVQRYDDLVAAAGQPFVAFIVVERGRRFAGGGVSRIAAIHAVWEIYQRFMNTPLEERGSQSWLYKNAVANVEHQVIENLNAKATK